MPKRAEEAQHAVRSQTPTLRAAAVGGVAYMGAKAGSNRAMQTSQPAPRRLRGPGATGSGGTGGSAAAGNERIARVKQLA